MPVVISQFGSHGDRVARIAAVVDWFQRHLGATPIRAERGLAS